MTTDVRITLRRDGDGFQWHATLPPTATDDDRAAVAEALLDAVDEFSPEIDDGGERDINAACCSAMRMIRLLSLDAPKVILEKEISNLTRLVETVCQGRPE